MSDGRSAPALRTADHRATASEAPAATTQDSAAAGAAAGGRHAAAQLDTATKCAAAALFIPAPFSVGVSYLSPNLRASAHVRTLRHAVIWV